MKTSRQRRAWRWERAALLAAGLALWAGTLTATAQSLSERLPEGITLRRRALTPHHAILEGHSDDLDVLADLLEQLAILLGDREPELHQAVADEQGWSFRVVLPFPACGKTQAALRAALFHQICVGESRKISDIPTIPRLDLVKNFSLSRAADFRHRLLPVEALRAQPVLRPTPPRAAEAVPGESGLRRPMPEDQAQIRADRRALARVLIDDIVVEEIHRTSVGGMAVVRAGARGYLLRQGDLLADGDVDQIRFSTPGVGWVRLRRRTGEQGIPYRPVVWILSGPPKGAGTGRWSIGEAGEPEPEIRRLGDERQEHGSEPPWTWRWTVEAAPRLFADILSTDKDSAATLALIETLTDDVLDPESWLTVSLGFGDIVVRFTSRQSVQGALASALERRRLQPASTRRPPSELTDRSESLYQPGERRDPFRPMVPGLTHEATQRGPRPLGIPGLLIDEVEVRALFRTTQGELAEIRSEGRNYFAKPPDQLFDGDLVAIDARGVHFKQIVSDANARRPFRYRARRVDPRWNGLLNSSVQGSPLPPLAPCPRWQADPALSSAGMFDMEILLQQDEESVCRPWEVQERAGQRDPFVPPTSAGPAPAAVSQPGDSMPAGLGCADLVATPTEKLDELLRYADRWQVRLTDERRRVARRSKDQVVGARRYLADVEEEAISRLAYRLGLELAHDPLLGMPGPAPAAEVFALLGDVRLIRGRLMAAAWAYYQARKLSSSPRSLCGGLHDGKLYGVEVYPQIPYDEPTADHRLRMTHYLLAWDLVTGRVVERHLMPMDDPWKPTSGPRAFTDDGTALVLRLENGRDLRIRGGRPEAPSETVTGSPFRIYALLGGSHLAKNFLTGDPRTPFAIRSAIDPRRAVTLVELEEALHRAADLDPTQPWHRFFLGQALWASGRREEAAEQWRQVWQGGVAATPYYELLAMAAVHEANGQTTWAELALDRALAARPRLAAPRTFSSWVRWWVLDRPEWGVGSRLHQDPERAYLWRLHLRRMEDGGFQEAVRAALWADHFERQRDRARARAERAFLAQAQRDPFDPILPLVWIDYSLYGALVTLGVLSAQLVLIVGGLLRRFRRRRAGIEVSGKAVGVGILWWAVEVSVLLGLLFLILSLGLFAASYQDYVLRLSGQVVDLADANNSIERFRLEPGELLDTWWRSGVIEPYDSRGSWFPLRPRDLYDPAVVLPRALFGLVGLFVLALPPGLLLHWRPAKEALTRLVPGAALVRTGARRRGLVVFGLFLFTIVVILWLAVAWLWGGLAAPGLCTALGLVYWDSPPWLLPPTEGIAVVTRADAEWNFQRLRARSFWTLLGIFPGAETFWTLVVGAGLSSLLLHRRSLRRWREAPGGAR